MTKALAATVEWYHERSKGHMPAAITPHMFRTVWAGNQFDNGKLKSFGWRQTVSTEQGLDRYFQSIADQAAGASPATS